MVKSTTGDAIIITRKEWLWVFAVAAVTLATSSLPMAVGYLAQTDEQRFAGTVYDVQDYFSHLAKIQLGARGEFRYRSLFTPEPHDPQPIIYNDILLGAIAAPLGIPLSTMYELSRLSGGLVLLVIVYQFIATFVEDLSTRRLAYVIAIASSGIGWLFLTTPAFSYPNQSPIEFWLADGYLLFSIMAFPHFGWSIAAMLAAFLAWRAYAERPRPRHLMWFVAFSSLLGLIQIFELALLDVVIGLDAVRRLTRERQALKPVTVAALVIGPLQLLMLWPYLHATQSSDFIQAWQQQSRTLSPPPHYYLVGYGLLWPLIGLGLWWVWRQRQERLFFPAAWLAAAAVLVYAPGGIQYRWLEGVSVPLAIFAALGLERSAVPAIAARLPVRMDPARLKWWIAVLAILATTPSTLYLIAGNALLAGTHWKEAFFTRGQVLAIDWLASNSEPDDTVLAWLKVGNAIPGRIGHRVFFGHWAETMYFAEKGRLTKAFFSDMPDRERQTLLTNYGIRFVFHGPEERALGEFDPARASYLTLRYKHEDTAVYEVSSP